jgi:hypothetical protein
MFKDSTSVVPIIAPLNEYATSWFITFLSPLRSGQRVFLVVTCLMLQNKCALPSSSSLSLVLIFSPRSTGTTAMETFGKNDLLSSPSSH